MKERSEDFKIPWHIRQYVKKELMDYKANKSLIVKCKGNTRGLILASWRIEQIDKVMKMLSKEDREAAELIFFEKYTQGKAEIEKGITKAIYYNTMNKVIFLTAVEMELI